MARRTGPGAKEAVQSRIRSYLVEERMQCSQCVLLMLEDALPPYGSQVAAAARVLGRGIGGSGNMCGALVAGALALGLGEQGGSGGPLEEEGPPLAAGAARPRNDWLDVFSLQTEEPAQFGRCRELFSRVAARVPPLTRSLNCSDISGVDWGGATPLQLSSYNSPEGGLARCIEVIAATTQTVRELLPHRSGQHRAAS